MFEIISVDYNDLGGLNQGFSVKARESEETEVIEALPVD